MNKELEFCRVKNVLISDSLFDILDFKIITIEHNIYGRIQINEGK